METIDLERKVAVKAFELGISSERWEKFFANLVRLRYYHPDFYAHSLRVGIYSEGIAQAEDFPYKNLALMGGCGHDLGKLKIGRDVLNANPFTRVDFEIVKQHVHYGFDEWKDSFLFTGFIAGLHHMFQPCSYGIDLNKCSPFKLSSPQVNEIFSTAELVGVADYFDAITTRHNERELLHSNDPNILFSTVASVFPGQYDRVVWLVNNQIQ
jgi:HD-GYP domain-containing protein (c-di-GMP phosphodiesterase class II)